MSDKSSNNPFASGSDLLENFKTWPPHLQASFLDMISHQVIEEQTMERSANLSVLDMMLDDFRTAMGIVAQKWKVLMDELQDNEDSDRYLKDLADKADLIERIEKQKERLTEIEEILKREKVKKVV